ncbi:MAG TPA: response regulator transcription factor [Actinomycetota bacterium]
MSQRLMLVEDDDAIVDPLVRMLVREGFSVTRHATAEDAIAALPAGGPDLVILDIALPGMSGLDACRVMHEKGFPVILLTARGEPVDRIIGLELGADDYVTKPFSARELAARVRAVLRRGRGPSPDRIQSVGALEVNPSVREVRVEGRLVQLTRREFDLLAFLASRSPAVVPREEIMTEVWDAHWFGGTETLDVHVGQVRRKIEPDPHQPRYLHTVRGVGYQLRDAWAAG